MTITPEQMADHHHGDPCSCQWCSGGPHVCEELRAQTAAAQLALREHVAAVALSDKVYLDEIRRVTEERDLAKAGHEGQTRNTLAFQDDYEREKARADKAEAERDEARELQLARDRLRQNDPEKVQNTLSHYNYSTIIDTKYYKTLDIQHII